jgi:hypothetical protein
VLFHFLENRFITIKEAIKGAIKQTIRPTIEPYQSFFSISALIDCLISGSRMPTANFALKKPCLLPQSKLLALEIIEFDPAHINKGLNQILGFTQANAQLLSQLALS